MAFIPKKTEVGKKGPLLGGEASLMKLKGSLKGLFGARKNPILGGEASLAKMREGIKKPPHIKEIKKEQKKDPSLFQGRQYLTRPEVSRLFKKDWAWKITRLPANVRSKLGEKLWNLKRFGNLIDQREANTVYKDIKDYPTTRGKTKYGMKSREETIRTVKLLKKFLGK